MKFDVPYGWLSEDILGVLDSVCASVIQDVPGTKKFLFGNACALNGICPGNPSHKDLRCIDPDYPTYSGIGTQYGGWERIWLDNNSDNMILDESKINWKAIWQFLIRLKAYCIPGRVDCQFIIHEKIMDLIQKNISYQDFITLNGIVSTDTGKTFNHHNHMHLCINLK